MKAIGLVSVLVFTCGLGFVPSPSHADDWTYERCDESLKKLKKDYKARDKEIKKETKEIKKHINDDFYMEKSSMYQQGGNPVDNDLMRRLQEFNTYCAVPYGFPMYMGPHVKWKDVKVVTDPSQRRGHGPMTPNYGTGGRGCEAQYGGCPTGGGPHNVNAGNR
jgi:hypothetical protein